MIDYDALMLFSHFFSDERQLEKDYLINLMVKTISINRISADIEFKGGTSLYMLNGLDRFSEDLDFSYIGSEAEIAKRIDSMIEPILADFNLSYKIYKSKGNIVVRDASKRVSSIRTELFIEGPLFSKTGSRHKIKMDISTRGDAIMKPESSRLVSRYPDIGTILIYSMPIEEILAEKFCAILERAKARDIYDAYFMLKYKNLEYDEKIVKEKLDRRNEKFDLDLIGKRIRSFKESKWKEELNYLIKSLPEISEVKAFITGRIR